MRTNMIADKLFIREHVILIGQCHAGATTDLEFYVNELEFPETLSYCTLARSMLSINQHAWKTSPKRFEIFSRWNPDALGSLAGLPWLECSGKRYMCVSMWIFHSKFTKSAHEHVFSNIKCERLYCLSTRKYRPYPRIADKITTKHS